MDKDKPLYISAKDHKFMKDYVKKHGGYLRVLTAKIISNWKKSVKK